MSAKPPPSPPPVVLGPPPGSLGAILGENLPVRVRQQLLREIGQLVATRLELKDLALATYVANTLNPAAANNAQMNLSHEKLLFDALTDARKDSENVGLVLHTLGGVGDFPTRIVRYIREGLKARAFVVLVPQLAKSAGTLLSLAADKVVTGPASQFGPIDPQLPRVTNAGQMWVSARAVKESYETLLGTKLKELPPSAQMGVATTIDWLLYQQALDSIRYTKDFVATVRLGTHPGLKETEVVRDLIDTPLSHGSDVSPSKLASYGVPVVDLEPGDAIWQKLDEYHSRALKGLLMELVAPPAASLVLFESPRTSFAINAVLQQTAK
jgi:Serine dehydrogenase proteinase